ncbi:MAG: hypothetical protein EBU30_02975 [Synechococcaceae bacterium WB6_3B_236]|nr:hypothetical protein [Synechococcaceae bacterium WB6_3B_236]
MPPACRPGSSAEKLFDPELALDPAASGPLGEVSAWFGLSSWGGIGRTGSDDCQQKAQTP